MSKKLKKDKPTIEDYAFIFGALILSFGTCKILRLPKFVIIILFFIITCIYFNSLEKKKELQKKQEELLKQQEIQRQKLLKQQEIERQKLLEEENKRKKLLEQKVEKEIEEQAKKAKQLIEEKKKQQEQIILKKQEPKAEQKVIKKNNSNSYVLEYENENEYRKLERSVKKYNMLAYKKLLFEYYPLMRDGKFPGKLISTNKKEQTYKYELELPTDTMFRRVHGPIIVSYTVYEKEKMVIFSTITPKEVLLDGHTNELINYKGVMVSKTHGEKDKFKIDLLNMLQK